jgi:hypothetical protein
VFAELKSGFEIGMLVKVDEPPNEELRAMSGGSSWGHVYSLGLALPIKRPRESVIRSKSQ